jgi:hypothetical protein
LAWNVVGLGGLGGRLLRVAVDNCVELNRFSLPLALVAGMQIIASFTFSSTSFPGLSLPFLPPRGTRAGDEEKGGASTYSDGQASVKRYRRFTDHAHSVVRLKLKQLLYSSTSPHT